MATGTIEVVLVDRDNLGKKTRGTTNIIAKNGEWLAKYCERTIVKGVQKPLRPKVIAEFYGE